MTNSKIFGKLSEVGRSLMLPIAVLPIAGILLGIGASFTNQNTINAYGLQGILNPSTALYKILLVFSAAGGIVFTNLPLLFAIGVATGLAKKEKGSAALAAVLGFLMMHATINAILQIDGTVDQLKEITALQAAKKPLTPEQSSFQAGFTNVLGISPSFSMGVFGGIISGSIAAYCSNKFLDVKLPEFLGFFGGPRFIPIIVGTLSIVAGMLLYFIWPPIATFLASLAGYIKGLGAIGSLLHGIIERSLIPFGLHHVYYTPLWQTQLGGTELINGVAVSGTQNQFFAYLGAGQLEKFTSQNFMSGKFPFMMFGLPGAALAMYHTAKPENRKMVGSILGSAALTSFLTGITEPIEFTFLFVAPILFFAVHVPLAGLSFMLMDLLGVKVGQTFSGGAIDFVLFGVLPGGVTNWIWIVVVGIVYFFIYYFLFKFLIEKFDIKTPGRGGEGDDMSLKTRADLEKKNESGSNGSSSAVGAQSADEVLSEKIVAELGGYENLDVVDACITRLRITLKDGSKVSNTEVFKNKLEAAGAFQNGNGIQIVYGARAAKLKSIIEDKM
jgi:glucose-like phosphotransferase system IIB component